MVATMGAVASFGEPIERNLNPRFPVKIRRYPRLHIYCIRVKNESYRPSPNPTDQ